MANRKPRTRTTKPSNKAGKINKNAGAAKTEKQEKTVTKEKVKVFMEEQRLTVTVGTSAEYGKAKLGISLSKNLKEGADPLAVADELYGTLSEKLEEQFDALCEKLGIADEYEEELGDDEGSDDGEYEEDPGDDDGEYEEDPGDDADCDDITEDEILKMTKKECAKLIKDEGLELNPKDYSKVGGLREAIIDALFEPADEDDDDGEYEEEPGDDDGEWEDEEWGDEE